MSTVEWDKRLVTMDQSIKSTFKYPEFIKNAFPPSMSFINGCMLMKQQIVVGGVVTTEVGGSTL